MPILIENEAIVAKLSAISNPEELRTSDGRILGQFIPAVSKKMTFPELGMTDEELDRIDRDPNTRWYSAEEVTERIRRLRKSS